MNDMAEIPERLATLEIKMDIIEKSVEHLDKCIDDLKKTVWRASGAVAAIVLISNLFLHK